MRLSYTFEKLADCYSHQNLITSCLTMLAQHSLVFEASFVKSFVNVIALALFLMLSPFLAAQIIKKSYCSSVRTNSLCRAIRITIILKTNLIIFALDQSLMNQNLNTLMLVNQRVLLVISSMKLLDIFLTCNLSWNWNVWY